MRGGVCLVAVGQVRGEQDVLDPAVGTRPHPAPFGFATTHAATSLVQGMVDRSAVSHFSATG